MPKFTTKERMELMRLLERAMDQRVERERQRAATTSAFRPPSADRRAPTGTRDSRQQRRRRTRTLLT